MPTARWTLRIGRLTSVGLPSASEARTRLDELAVEGAVQPVVLLAGAVQRGRGGLDRLQDRAEIELARLPVVPDRGLGVEALHVPDGLRHGAKAQLGEQLTALGGDVVEERLDELGAPGEVLAKFRVLRGDADRAGVQVADARS